MTESATPDPTPRRRGMRTWEPYGAGLLAIAVIGAALVVRPGASPGATWSGSPSASVASSTSPSEQPMELPSPSASTSAEPGASLSSSPVPTGIPTPQPTARPTAKQTLAPTPQPTPQCVPEDGGWMVYSQRTVVPGGTMEIKLWLPAYELMHLDVDYPNGQTVSLGDKVVQWVGDTSYVQWIWTVPANMPSGTGRARWTGSCGTRSYDGYADFTIIGPATPPPTPIPPSDSPAPSV